MWETETCTLIQIHKHYGVVTSQALSYESFIFVLSFNTESKNLQEHWLSGTQNTFSHRNDAMPMTWCPRIFHESVSNFKMSEKLNLQFKKKKWYSNNSSKTKENTIDSLFEKMSN